MKKCHLFTAVLLLIKFLQNAALAQHYEAVDALRYKVMYQLTYLPDSGTKELTQQEYMTLQIGRDISVFQSYAGYVKDSLFVARKVWTMDSFNALEIIKKAPKSKFNYVIRKDISERNLTVESQILKDRIAYKEALVSDWVLLPDTLTVAGYLCQKATTTYEGRDYVAWFTTELPIADGPYKFGGLPGLIVRLYDSRRHYTFSLVEFRAIKTNQAIYLPQEKRTYVAKSKFYSLKKEADDSFHQMVQRMGINLTYTVGGVEQSAQEMDRLREDKVITNPMELPKK
ncbi:GLPGLI family protein [Arundinibacter roseus]|uniref:GLPGLI family protein n=1 Tax=Arundinibacter roseus TaxID=2070510 RepID=A0A4R4KHE6_9BACT|nr:GLPGLI family protein [Arundinibacter roseus]TDB67540.1 GLPGLI family protein [Arundinibacter roseus]